MIRRLGYFGWGKWVGVRIVGAMPTRAASNPALDALGRVRLSGRHVAVVGGRTPCRPGPPRLAFPEQTVPFCAGVRVGMGPNRVTQDFEADALRKFHADRPQASIAKRLRDQMPRRCGFSTTI